MSQPKHIVWPAFAASGVFAVFSSVVVASAIGNPTPVDRALPIIVLALVVFLGASADGTFSSAASIALPATLMSAVAIQEPTIRLLAYGLIVATTVGFVTARLTRQRFSSPSRLTSIAVAITALMVFIPADAAFMPAKLLIVAGTTVLAAVLWQSAAKRPVGLAVIVLVAACTPIEPLGAAMFPTILALVLHYRMRRSHIGAVLAIAVSAMAGRWALALVLLIIVVDGVSRLRVPSSRVRSSVLTPFFPSWKNAAFFGRAVPFAMSVAGRLGGLNGSATACVVIVLGTGFMLRPALSWLYSLAALAIVVAESGERISEAWDLPILAIALVMLILFPWSGIAAIPPVPVSLPVVVVTMLVASVPLMTRQSRLAGVAVFAVFLGAIWFGQRGAEPPVREIYAPGTVGPGESISYPIGGASTSVAVMALGAHMNELRAGTLVGRIDVVGTDGRVWRSPIRVGDIADWGAFRPGYAFGTWNPFPTDPDPNIEGFGTHAWVRPVGRIRVNAPVAIEAVTITADESLRSEARLDVEGVEIR